LAEESSLIDICVLSAEEAGRLEHFGIWPSCKRGAHRHLKYKILKPLLDAGALRWCGGKDTCAGSQVSMVTAVRIKIWQPVPTAGAMGLRTWGLTKT
jgi:hypothetical protein